MYCTYIKAGKQCCDGRVDLDHPTWRSPAPDIYGNGFLESARQETPCAWASGLLGMLGDCCPQRPILDATSSMRKFARDSANQNAPAFSAFPVASALRPIAPLVGLYLSPAVLLF